MFFSRLEDISVSASKEFSLEKSLEKMKLEWAEMYFEFIPYRDTVWLARIHFCVLIAVQLSQLPN